MDSPQKERIARLSASETLTATILHELNQPLAAAAMHIAGLQRMAETIDAPVDRETLSYGLDRLDHLVKRSALVITRVRAVVLDERPIHAPTNIDSIFSNAMRAIHEAPGWDRVLVETDTSWSPEELRCDSVQIEQVVANLLLNAVEATRKHPSPSIVLRAIFRRTLIRGRFVEVVVTDNGPGLTPEQQKEVFRPFKHGNGGSTGLGLALCRSLVEFHGGEIWYEQSRSSGASFHFTLPLEQRGRKK